MSPYTTRGSQPDSRCNVVPGTDIKHKRQSPTQKAHYLNVSFFPRRSPPQRNHHQTNLRRRYKKKTSKQKNKTKKTKKTKKANNLIPTRNGAKSLCPVNHGRDCLRRTAVPFWGQTTQFSSTLVTPPPKRDHLYSSSPSKYY